MKENKNIIIINNNNNDLIEHSLNNEFFNNEKEKIYIKNEFLEFECSYSIKNNNYKFYLVKLITNLESKIQFNNFQDNTIIKIRNNSIITISDFNYSIYENFEIIKDLLLNCYISKSLKFENIILKIKTKKNQINFNNFLSVTHNENNFIINSKLINNYKIIINKTLFLTNKGLIRSKKSIIEINSLKNSKYNLNNFPIIEISKITEKNFLNFKKLKYPMGFFGEIVLIDHIKRFKNKNSKYFSGKTISEKGIDLIFFEKKIIYLFEAKCIKDNSFKIENLEEIYDWFENNLKSFIKFNQMKIQKYNQELLEYKNFLKFDFIKYYKNFLKNNQLNYNNEKIINLEFLVELEEKIKFKENIILNFSSIYFDINLEYPIYLLIRKYNK